MQPPQSKLILPTVDTCRWRHASASGGMAECGLVASLLGVAATPLAAVADEACAACCRSFPPSRRKPNPVVAGLLHGAATRLLASPGPAGVGAPEAMRALAMAEAALDVHLPERQRLTPARGVVPCAWRGGPAAVDESLGPVGAPVGEPPSSPGPPEEGPVHRCDHPDHAFASPARCRMCRDWSRRRPISRPMTLAELVPPPGRRCGRPVRNWAVGVTTSPRRRPTLEACLDGIVRAGWGAPRLFLDGTAPVPPRHAHLPTTWREEGIGAWPAWFLALAELLVQRPDADAYLMLQDDVALHEREPLRDYLERILWPGDRPGLVLLFYTGAGTTPGWRPRADPWHTSAQGLLFPPGLARALIADPPSMQAVLASSADVHTPIPDVINAWVGRHAVDCWYPTPSLAQHVGNASAIWEHAALTGRRRAPWFSGSLEAAFALEEDLADFPEEAFPRDPARGDDYRSQVDRGRDRMRACTVVIGGTWRDVRHLLPRLAARVERLGSLFRDYRVVLVADGSTDRTCEFLADWRAANPRVEVLPAPPAGGTARRRDDDRDRIVAGHRHRDHAIIVAADLAGGWSYDGIAHTFGADDWDFVGSLDLALGPVGAEGSAPWIRPDRGAGRPATATATRTARAPVVAWPGRGGPMVPVGACCGGLGVYRMAYLAAGTSAGASPASPAGRRRPGPGRLFLNPNQVALHSPA